MQKCQSPGENEATLTHVLSYLQHKLKCIDGPHLAYFLVRKRSREHQKLSCMHQELSGAHQNHLNFFFPHISLRDLWKTDLKLAKLD